MMKDDDLESPPPQEEGAPAPPQDPQQPNYSPPKSAPKVSNWIKIGVAASALAAVGLGVGLGVGLSRRNARAEAAAAASVSQAGDGEVEEETTTTTTLIGTVPSTPSSGEGTLAPDKATTTTTTTSAAEEEEKPPVKDDKPDDEGAPVLFEPGTGDISQSQIYTSSDAEGSGIAVGKLEWEFRTFSQEVLDGYESCNDLAVDLRYAANFLVRGVIIRNAEQDHYYGFPEEDGEVIAMPAEAPAPGATEGDMADGDMAASEGAASASKEADGGGGETDFDTNEQVEGVREVDLVKSDGKHVFSAYGDTIVVWDAVTGEVLSRTVMPPPETDEDFDDEDCYYPKPMPVDEVEVEDEEEGEEEVVDLDEEEGGTVVSAPASAATSSGTSSVARPGPGPEPEKKSMPYDPCYRRSRPRTTIKGLLLHGNRLVAFVGGYQPRYYHWSTPDEDRPILSGYGTTHVKVFDTSATKDVVDQVKDEEGNDISVTHTELVQVSESELPGDYKEGRAVGSRIHSVTMSNINTYYHLTRPLSRWDQRYQGMDKDAYIAKATEVAEEAVANFVKKLISEIRTHHGEEEGDAACRNIVKLSIFQTGDLGDPLAHDWWRNDGILGGLGEVFTFDVETDPPQTANADGSIIGPAVLKVKTSTAFVPNVWSTNLYATRNMLFVATRGYDAHKRWGHIESTFIYIYRMPGGEDADDFPSDSAMAIGVGKVPGTVINQYSMDFWNDHFRIATSTGAKWGCVHKNGTVIENPWNNGKRIPCDWKQWRDPHNQVAVLTIDEREKGGLLKEVGTTAPKSLGKPGETITAVRFQGETAFVVTFERIDPLLILDMSDETNPKILGELEVPGWSNYIHPTGDENNPTILAVGQDADEDGRQLGLQISLFGFSNKSDPRLLDRAMAEEGDDEDIENQWSSSEVQFDPKAFRYLQQSQVALLPATVQGRWQTSVEQDEDGTWVKTERWEFFDGFYFFAVNTTKGHESIKKMFRVNLARDYCGWGCGRCYGSRRMPARSLVFGGNATLIKGHYAESWRIEEPKKGEKRERRWEVKLADHVSKDQCFDYFG